MVHVPTTSRKVNKEQQAALAILPFLRINDVNDPDVAVEKLLLFLTEKKTFDVSSIPG